MHYTESEIKELNSITRLKLMNSITGIKSANLIGTISEKGCTNLAIFSSLHFFLIQTTYTHAKHLSLCLTLFLLQFPVD